MLQLQKCFDEFLETLLHSLNRDVGENCRHCPQYFNILQFYSHMVSEARCWARSPQLMSISMTSMQCEFHILHGHMLCVCWSARVHSLSMVFDTGALCACAFHVVQGTMACSHLFGRQAFQRMAFFLLGESNHASNANQVRAHFPTYVISIQCKCTCTLLYRLTRMCLARAHFS